MIPPKDVPATVPVAPAVPVPEPKPDAINEVPSKGCPVIVIGTATVWLLLIVYVPEYPTPVPNAVMYVPAVMPVPVI